MNVECGATRTEGVLWRAVNKILHGKGFERQLQIVMQLAALHKYGGTVVQLGATGGNAIPAAAAAGGVWIHKSSGSSVVNGGGVAGASAGNAGDAKVSAMLAAFVNGLKPAPLTDPKYDRASWPWTHADAAAVAALDAAAAGFAKQTSLLDVDQSGAQKESFALLSFYSRQAVAEASMSAADRQRYRGGAPMNIGDNMQQLASAQFMPYIDRFVEREDLDESWSDGGAVSRGAPAALLGEHTKYVANGWYDYHMKVWPPPGHLDPVLTAVHFDGDVPKGISAAAKSYYYRRWPILGARDEITQRVIQQKTGVNGVWTGDSTWTLAPLCKRGDGEGGALGGALKDPAAAAAAKYIIVDVDPGVLARLVPKHIRDAAVYISHKATEPPLTSHELARYAGMHEYLRKYACEAKLLITSRLHAAMPTAAMGTPVVLIDDPATLMGGGGAKGTARLAGLENVVHVLRPQDAQVRIIRLLVVAVVYVHTSQIEAKRTHEVHRDLPRLCNGTRRLSWVFPPKQTPCVTSDVCNPRRRDGFPKTLLRFFQNTITFKTFTKYFLYHSALYMQGKARTFDWENPPPNPEVAMRTEKASITRLLLACSDERYLDAGVKFGAMGEKMVSQTLNQPLPQPPCPAAAAADSGVIHVATGADVNYLQKKGGVPLATWAKALGTSNPGQVFAVYLLTDGMSKQQQCMLRNSVRSFLAEGSTVRTIDVADALPRNTHLLQQVSRVTMARLLLPKLLPCVRKTLWIDVDALAVAPLAPLFAVQPAAPCGVAGRKSIISSYLVVSYVGPDKDSIKHKLRDTVTFNAGVVVMDLDILRGQPGYESTVDRIANRYGNDDQVALNMWCMKSGGYTQLDPKWNIFNNMAHRGGQENDPELDKPRTEWGIVHYAGSWKPWDDGTDGHVGKEEGRGLFCISHASSS